MPGPYEFAVPNNLVGFGPHEIDDADVLLVSDRKGLDDADGLNEPTLVNEISWGSDIVS